MARLRFLLHQFLFLILNFNPRNLLFFIIVISVLRQLCIEWQISTSLPRFFSTKPYPTRNYSNSNRRESSMVDEDVFILTWTKYFGEDIEEGPIECANGRRCSLTNDRSKLAQSRAIVFHERDIRWSDLPQRKSPDQYFVYFTWESPYNTEYILDEPRKRSMFNLTMTYRRDSDVFTPYGRVIRRRSPIRLNLNDLIRNKTKPLVWMVSNCRTQSKRELLVEKIRRHMPVDIYGRCGRYACRKDLDDQLADSPKTCGHIFEQNYKFYLSFENSLCQDYVTEKFFRRIQRYLVPIVLERANYVNLCPEYRQPWFIAVDDFESFDQFVAYLKYLNGNTTAYYEYLRWHEYNEIEMRVNSDTVKNTKDHWCDLCDAVRRGGKRTYEDMEAWWKHDTCH